MKTIQVDESHLGRNWRGSFDDLRAFAKLYGEELAAGTAMSPVAVIAVRGVAHNDVEDDPYLDGLDSEAWLRAIDRHAAEHPECWTI
jgi:hypothetical protein